MDKIDKNEIMLNKQVQTSTSILHLIRNDQVTIEQVNGQRKLNGPPVGWVGPPPGPGTEVFVGKLPRELLEDKIYPFFSKVGKIYELRLMMDFSGNNRGYCFVTFTTPEEAERAINLLNEKEIIPGKKIGVILSINNCKLWLGRLPKNTASAEVIVKVCRRTDEVEKVSVFRNSKNEAEFAIVAYKTHRGAAMARRILVPEKNKLFSTSISIDWANPDISPSNIIEESGVAIRSPKTKDLFIIKEIRRKIIGCPFNRSLPFASKSREEILNLNMEYYLEENDRSSSKSQEIDKNSNSKDTKNLNKPLTSNKQKKVVQQHGKKSSNVPMAPNPFQLPRPVRLIKEEPSKSFSLFDDFTFSLSPPTSHGDEEWPSQFNESGMDSLNQNNSITDTWVDDFASRLSNLSLPEQHLYRQPQKMSTPRDGGTFSTLLQDTGFSAPRGNINDPSNLGFQSVIYPEKGFPFHQPGPSDHRVLPDKRPYVYPQFPEFCVIPQQMPYAEPWPQNLLNNRAFYGCSEHHCMPTTCGECIERFGHSNLQRMPEPYKSTCYSQHAQSHQDAGYHQEPEASYPQAIFRGHQKSRTVLERPKSARKAQTVLNMNLSRTNQYSENQQVTEQLNFVSRTADQISKTARPILSSWK